MNKRLPKILAFSLVFALLFTLFPIQPMEVHAANSDKNGGVLTFSPLAKDDEVFYYLLEADLPEEEESAIWQGGKLNDIGKHVLGETVNFINNTIFYANVYIALGTLAILDGSVNVELIDKMIDRVSHKVKSITGVSGTAFNRDGMFFPILRFIVLFVIIYAFYKLVWQRSFIESFSELLKFITVLTVALLLFANYGTFLKSVNTVSSEISQFIVGSRINATFQKSVWSHLVDEPYLFLQYGTSDLKELGNGNQSEGKKRVRQLLLAKPFSEKRKEIVEKEINELDNHYMTYNAGMERLGLNIIYLTSNFITFLSFIVMGLAILFAQMWFVIIAIFAPLAFLIASFPSQFNVLKRYSFELILPLLVKIGLHFMLVIIMLLTTLATDFYKEVQDSVFSGKILHAIIINSFYILLFFGIFLLRKRIAGILSSGSKMVSQIREGMASLTTRPLQSGVQTATTVGGLVVGAATGGLAGAGIGARIGGLAGRVVTGQSGGIAQAAEDLGRIAYEAKDLNRTKEVVDYLRNMNQNQNVDENDYAYNNDSDNRGHTQNMNDTDNTTNENMDGNAQGNYEESNEQEEKYSDRNSHTHVLYGEINKFADDMGMSDTDKQQIIDEFFEQGVDIANVDEKVLNEALINGYDKDGNPILMNPVKNPELFAQRVNERMRTVDDMKSAIKSKRLQKFTDFLQRKGLSQKDAMAIVSNLSKKNIDVSSIPKDVYEDAYRTVKQRIDAGEDLNMVTELTNEIERRAQLVNYDSGDIAGTESYEKLINQTTESEQAFESGSPLESKPLDANTTDSQPLGRKPLDGSELKSQALNQNTLDSKPLGDEPLDGSRLESQPLNQNTLDSKPLGSKSVEGSTLKSKPLTGSSSKSSSIKSRWQSETTNKLNTSNTEPNVEPKINTRSSEAEQLTEINQRIQFDADKATEKDPDITE